MPVRSFIFAASYRDSAFLMKLSSQARQQSGISNISAMMGTPRNKELLARSGLLTPELELAAPEDLLVAIEGPDALLDKAERIVRNLLREPPVPASPQTGGERPCCLSQAMAEHPQSQVAIISVAGDYAHYEAAKALQLGLDVLLYSDNISIEAEQALKAFARRKNRLLMGPDCGTAIINRIPLGFANQVRRGLIGLVGASGTGLQEVSSLLDRCGLGVSQVYGTGSRDMTDAIGGLSALNALERLAQDAGTEAIAVIAKFPGKATRAKLASWYRKTRKPVIVCYLGEDDMRPEKRLGILTASNLTELALLAARTVAPMLDTSDITDSAPLPERLRQPGWIRGVFSGGSLCFESLYAARQTGLKNLHSNLHAAGVTHIAGHEPGRGHTFLDMGADEFTVGCPHPLVSPELKMQRLIEEMCSPGVSVALTDIVLGHGTCPHQAAALVQAVDKAATLTGGASRRILVAASVCGTEADTPSRSSQIALLRQAGIHVPGSNMQAALWAARVVAKALPRKNAPAAPRRSRSGTDQQPA
ncbi:MAG TPA: hypothetical protein IAB01_08240 [Candidatus Avidesulfovibrio excrementigallinarum]|nr:hypothetical protein [Candidatus Avidesulfovibrio excrementigallinarum]